MKKALIVIMLACLSALLMPAWSDAGWLIYRKPEFKGRLIDAETKRPIEGVVVVAMYRTHPILSGPGGGSSSIIHVKEALTNDRGEFHIPAYTTLIQPNSYADFTEFIIYKPGYESYPHRYQQNRIYPLDYCGPEILFSKEIGVKEEMEHKSGVVSITYGIAELSELETKEERLRAIPSTRPGELSPEDIPLLYKMINEERKYFGLGEIGRVGE